MTVGIDEGAVLRVVCRYFREKGCFESLASVLLETNLGIMDDLPSEFLYVQRLMLQGKWPEADRLLRPVMDKFPVMTPKISFLIQRQRFLETDDREDHDLDDLIAQLNSLKPLCSVTHFNALCLFLSIDKLEDHPEYGSWTVAEGRIRCCEDIFLLLSTQLPQLFVPATAESASCTLQTVIGLCALHCIAHSLDPTAAFTQGLPELIAGALAVSTEPMAAHFTNPVPVLRKHSVPMLSAVPAPPVSRGGVADPVSGGGDLRSTLPWPQAMAKAPETIPVILSAEAAPAAPSPIAISAYAPLGPLAPSTVTPANKPAPVSWTVCSEAGEAQPSASKQPPAALRRRLTADAVRESHDSKPLAVSEPVVTPAPLSRRPDSAQSTQSQTLVAARQEKRERVESLAPPPVAHKRSSVLYQMPGTPLRCAAWLASEDADDDEDCATGDDFNDANSRNRKVHLVAVGSNNKTVAVLRYSPSRVFSCVDATPLVEQEAVLQDVHKGSVYAMDWQASSRLLVTGSNDKYLRVSRPLIGQVCSALKGHTGTVRVVKYRSLPDASFSDSLLLSAGAGDFRPRLWDVEKESCIRVLKEHTSAVHGLAWVTEHVAVTGCEGGHLVAHDLRSGQAAWTLSLSAQALADYYRSAESQHATARAVCSLAALQAHGSVVSLGVGSVSGYVSVLDLAQRAICFDSRLHAEDVRSVAGLANGDLVTSSYDCTAAVWRVRHGRAEQVAALRGAHSDKILSCVPVLQSSDLLTTGADGNVVLWSA